MTVDEIRYLYAFNSWATGRIFDACRSLSDEELKRDLRSSHRSIHGTLVHLLWVEYTWLRRLRGQSSPALFADDDFADLSTIESRWQAVDRERGAFVDTLTDDRLAIIFGYENIRNEHWEYPYGHALQHVVNHATYHRGQIVTMLRYLGRTPPATDFLEYYDEGGGKQWKPGAV